MAIEYIPLRAYFPGTGANLERTVSVKIAAWDHYLRLEIVDNETRGSNFPQHIDICLDAEDLWRAWQAVKPTDDWP